MSIKLYNANGIGLLIGEKLSQDDDFVYLKYPGIFIQRTDQRGQPHNTIMEPVPPIFKGRNEMLSRFPLKKSMILYSGQPVPEMVSLYENYRVKLQARITGIHVVGANAIPKEIA
jgi:hypothetical protein